MINVTDQCRSLGVEQLDHNDRSYRLENIDKVNRELLNIIIPPSDINLMFIFKITTCLSSKHD